MKVAVYIFYIVTTGIKFSNNVQQKVTYHVSTLMFVNSSGTVYRPTDTLIKYIIYILHVGLFSVFQKSHKNI